MIPSRIFPQRVEDGQSVAAWPRSRNHRLLRKLPARWRRQSLVCPVHCLKEKFSALTESLWFRDSASYAITSTRSYSRALSRSDRPIDDTFRSFRVRFSWLGNFTYTIRLPASYVVRARWRFRFGRIVKPERESRAEGNCTSAGCNLTHDALKYPRAKKGGDFDRIPVLRETISCANHTTTRASSLITRVYTQPRYLLA